MTLRCRDWVGRRVLLLRALRTNGGATFKKGRILEVYGTWRGMFHLHSLEPRKSDGCRDAIRRVHPRNTLVLVDESDLLALGAPIAWTVHPADSRYAYNAKREVRLIEELRRTGCVIQ